MRKAASERSLLVDYKRYFETPIVGPVTPAIKARVRGPRSELERLAPETVKAPSGWVEAKSDAALKQRGLNIGKLHPGPIPDGWDPEPVVLVACGSYSPPTLLHLRILEDAKHGLALQKVFVIGGFISPVHAAYGKKSLCAMYHRCNMVGGALKDSTWLDVDPWECQQEQYTPTRQVLQDHLTELLKGVKVAGATKPVRVLLVCGGDLLESFPALRPDGTPVWAPEDQEAILQCGLACIQREGTDLEQLIRGNELMTRYRSNIKIIEATVQNNMSSSLVRKVLAAGGPPDIKYLCHDWVCSYIARHRLHELPNWR